MIAHGTASKYSNDRCRCEDCRKAWAEYTTSRKRQRRAFVKANGLPSSVEHGESAYTNWGCRCDVCRAADTANRRKWAARQAANS
jgi:hypothetical protein